MKPSAFRNSIFIFLISLFFCIPFLLLGQGQGEVALAETLTFTNELANYSNDTATRKAVNVLNSLYNTSYDLKDAFSGNGSAASLNQSAIELANSLAAISDNPRFQKAVQNVNQFNAAYQELKSNFGSGLDAATSANLDAAAMALQALAFLDGLFSKPELTKGQLASLKYMKYTNQLLEKIYNEYSTPPEHNAYNTETWEKISSFEKRLDQYDKATARQRLLVLKFLNDPEVPEFSKLQQWTKEIKSTYESGGLSSIVAEVDKLTHFKTPDHLKNASKGLLGAKASVLLFKVNYSYKSGNSAEAEMYTDWLAGIAPYDQTKLAINTAFELGNHSLAARLCPVFFGHWMQSMANARSMLRNAGKKELAAVTAAGMNLSADIAVLSKAILSLAKTAEYVRAENYMEEAEVMYYNFMVNGQSKYQVATEYNPDAGTEKIYFNHAKALILMESGKYSEALQSTDSAIFYNNAANMFSGYVFKIRETRIDVLIKQKQFEKALSECSLIERDYMGALKSTNYDAANFKLMKALIFFNMGKLQPALSTIMASKAINPNLPKAFILEKEIYLAMNDQPSAKAASEALSKLYQKQ